MHHSVRHRSSRVRRGRFHRVVVTPGLKEARVSLTDSEPSLRLTPSVKGNDHYTHRGGTPFVVGQVDRDRGYVHIWDEVAVEHLMKELDTISDLLTYLRWKEDLVAAGKLLTAASESDLLGYYMHHGRKGSDARFLTPPPYEPLSVDAGSWELWANGSLRAARQAANEVSYLVDDLINHAAEQVAAGNTPGPIRDGFATSEQVLRQLAREPRLARRVLAKAWLKKIKDPRSAKAGFRVIQTGRDSVYVLFVASRLPHHQSEEEYRRERLNYLMVYCVATMSTYVPPVHLIGLATEPFVHSVVHTDVTYLDPSKWTPELQQVAVDARKETGFFTAVEGQSGFAVDSPTRANIDAMTRDFPPSYSLNGPCPCESGKRFKNCHGKSRKKVMQ